MTILAIDLGKFKSVSCFFDPATQQAGYRTLPTTPTAIHDLLVELSPTRLVVEVCTSSGWIADLAEALGIDVEVANPNTEGWRWKHVKRKTDKDDALKLAKLSAAGQLPTVHLPGSEVRRWRSLIVYRHKLVGRRTAIYNRLRATLDSVGRSHPAGCPGLVEGRTRQARSPRPGRWPTARCTNCGGASCTSSCNCSTPCRHRSKPSNRNSTRSATPTRRSAVSAPFPGVGPRLGELVVAMLDDPHRFRTARQVGSYAGLVPRRYQSGTYDYQGRVSKQGCAFLRKLLVEVAWAMRRHNPQARDFFDRVSAGEKTRRKKAAVATGRKVLTWCWALLRDQRDWQSDPPAPNRPRFTPGSAQGHRGVTRRSDARPETPRTETIIKLEAKVLHKSATAEARLTN